MMQMYVSLLSYGLHADIQLIWMKLGGLMFRNERLYRILGKITPVALKNTISVRYFKRKHHFGYFPFTNFHQNWHKYFNLE